MKDYCSALTAAGLLFASLSISNAVDLATDNDVRDEPQWESVLNCTNISLYRAKTVNVTLGTSATVCLITSLFILFLLLHFKKYNTPLERLFLFLTILTVVLEVGLALVVEHQFHYPGQEQFCEFLGFLNQCTGTMLYMLNAQVAFYLVFLVYKKLRGDPFQKISQSSRFCKLVECIYLFVPVTLVILESGYPYIGGGKYGFSINGCWIQDFNGDCENIGLKYQVASTGVDGGLSTISIISALVLVIVYCRMAYYYRKVKCPEILLLLQQTLLLMGFLVASPVILAISIILRFYLHSFALSIANSIGITISPLVIPVGYLVYIYATTHSKPGCCKCTFFRDLKVKVKLSKEKQRTRGPITERYHKTNPTSHPQDYPSETYFNNEHTGEFTHVDVAVQGTSLKLSSKELKPVPSRSSTHFDIEYTGEFTDITEDITQNKGQLLVTEYHAMA